VVQIRAQQIKNGDCRHFEKNVKLRYLRNRLTDFDEILHDDAFVVKTVKLPYIHDRMADWQDIWYGDAFLHSARYNVEHSKSKTEND